MIQLPPMQRTPRVFCGMCADGWLDRPSWTCSYCQLRERPVVPCRWCQPGHRGNPDYVCRNCCYKPDRTPGVCFGCGAKGVWHWRCYCYDCHPGAWNGMQPRPVGVRLNSPYWDDVQRQLKANAVCAHCDGDGDGWTAVDHIRPLELGGSNEDNNLQVLCIPCHKLKTKADMAVIADERRWQKMTPAAQELAAELAPKCPDCGAALGQLWRRGELAPRVGCDYCQEEV